MCQRSRSFPVLGRGRDRHLLPGLFSSILRGTVKYWKRLFATVWLNIVDNGWNWKWNRTIFRKNQKNVESLIALVCQLSQFQKRLSREGFPESESESEEDTLVLKACLLLSVSTLLTIVPWSGEGPHTLLEQTSTTFRPNWNWKKFKRRQLKSPC